MMVRDIINSCSNEKIAEAALASIGGTFAERVRATARKSGVAAGTFVAMTVRSFARRAGERDYHALRDAVLGTDQPVLHGLTLILRPALADENDRGSLPACGVAYWTVHPEVRACA